MQIFTGIRLHGTDSLALEHVEGFEHHWSLAPKARLADTITFVISADRLLRRDAECGHIFVPEQPVILPHEGVDLVCDFSAIKIIPNRVDPGLMVATGLLFRVNHR